MKTSTVISNMSAKTEKRILWAIAAVLVMAVIFAFSSQASFASEEASDALAELMNMEQQDLQTRVSNQSILFGLTLRKLAHIFLYAALGFCLYQALADVKRRLIIAVGAAYFYGVLDEIHQSLAGRYGRWQDTLIDLIGIALGLAAALLLPKLNILCKKWFYEDWDTKHPVAKKRLEWCLDALSLAAVIQYVGYRFLQTTMFEFIYSELYKTLTFLSLLVFGGVRFVYLFARKLWADADEKAQIRRFLKFIGVCVLSLPFFIVAYLHDYKVLIFIPICWMCLYDIQAELVFKWYVRVIGVMLAATVLCCLAGVVKNINSIYNGRFKEAYGILNSTDFASYCLFLLLYFWCQKQDSTFGAVGLAALMAVAGIYLYRTNESRTALICCVLAALANLWAWFLPKLSRKHPLFQRGAWLSDRFAIASFLVLFVVCAIGVCLYGQKNPWVVNLDETLLSKRIKPIWESYEAHGIHLFGARFTMHGNGGSLLRSGEVYDFLDSSYAYMIIRYGVVVTAIITALWIRMTVRAIRCGKRAIAYTMGVLAFYALSESQLVNINYCLFLILPFSRLDSTADESQSASSDVTLGQLDKRTWAGWQTPLAAFTVLGIVYFLLPGLLSNLRTLFWIEQWTHGTRAGYAYLICIGLALVVVALFKALAAFLADRKACSLACAAVAVLALVLGGALANQRLRQYASSHADALNAEAEAVQLIRDTAQQPIFAMEQAALYQREYHCVEERVMTPEDICREKQGTLFTEKSRELIWATSLGARYVQFSEHSGVYSFDPAVIEAMASAGYEWTGFYSSERVCSLEDLAELNHLHLSESGSLILEGPDHSLSENRYLDQVRTDYEVRFSLTLDIENNDLQDEDIVCQLQVLGNKGEETLWTQEVLKEEFDREGHCSLTLTYFSPFMPHVEYLVIAADGVTLYVDEIAWRRVG